MVNPNTEAPLNICASEKEEYGKYSRIPICTLEKGDPFTVTFDDSVCISYEPFCNRAEDLRDIIKLIQSELSEPYSIFTYCSFLDPAPDLTIMVHSGTDLIGVVVNKVENVPHTEDLKVGYIAMLTVRSDFRKRGIGRELVNISMDLMRLKGASEVSIDTEVTNTAALELYGKLGFIRTNRMTRYYVNCNDAFRLQKRLPIIQR